MAVTVKSAAAVDVPPVSREVSTEAFDANAARQWIAQASERAFDAGAPIVRASINNVEGSKTARVWLIEGWSVAPPFGQWPEPDFTPVAEAAPPVLVDG